MRDFYKEIDDGKFKPLSFGIFNQIDDDSFPLYLRNQYNIYCSIDDFEYQNFELSDIEKKMLKNNESIMNLNLTILKQKLSKHDKIRYYIGEKKNSIYVVRLKGEKI